MALLHGIRTLLTAKAAPVAAATLVIGGGAAIAAPGVTLDGGDDVEIVEIEEEEEHDWAIGRADDEQLDRIADFCGENPEAAFCSGDSDDPINWVPGAPSDEEAEESTLESDTPVTNEEEEDARSETARRVLEELSGAEAVMPGGGPEFGQAVSRQARDGQLGARVSRAARGDDEEESEVEERRKPGPPDDARGGADSSEQDDAEQRVTTGDEPKDEPKAEPKTEPEAEHRGPPASPGNSGNRGNAGRGN